jgi:tryptophanyl-tRNA synthetase
MRTTQPRPAMRTRSTPTTGALATSALATSAVTSATDSAASDSAASDSATADSATAGPRRLSGFKPTGPLHIGNYLGAIRPMVDGGRQTEAIVMIADLHALTVEHDPARLRRLTGDLLATLLACGVDPDTATCYVQSDVPEHAQLHYLLECATGYGEAARMIQFREKSAGQRHVRLSLLTYPVLMAADILLHDATEVPVGDDQSQHVELARDIANRFNTRYGRTFTVPTAVNPDVAARLMDLSDPTSKMGKTSTSDSGVLGLLDPPEVIARKVGRAVTDTGVDVTYDPYRKPGVANLLTLVAACERTLPASVASRFATYAELKQGAVQAVLDLVRPIQERRRALLDKPGHLERIRREGAERARERSAQTVRRAKRAIGL